jgi:hypothetical protein
VPGKGTQLLSISAMTRIRVVAVLLLASLAWGTTAEFTHHHGQRARPSLTTDQTANSALGFGDSVEPNNGTSTSTRLKLGTECLICQLQQNLSNTLLGHAPAISATSTHSLALDAAIVFHRADFSTSQRGRAPPINL